MRKRLSTFIAACFYYSGLVKLARWWAGHSRRHLIILNYHLATGGDLRRHLLYLSRHYRILHLETALEELYMPCKNEKRLHDRRTPLALTFDDGYHDNYTHGFALACEMQIPFTIFLIPGYIESGDFFWWREGNRLATHAQVREATIDGRIYHLDQLEERNMLAQTILARLCQASSVAEREKFLASSRKILAVPPSVPSEEKPALPLSWTEVREMDESGWVSFGAHTMYHPILAYLADPTEAQDEVKQSRITLEHQLGHPVRTFAYPIGQLQHIGENAIRAVPQAGYDWALTTINGFNTPKSDPYLLRRVEVDVDQHWLVLAAEAAGLWGLFSRLRWMLTMRKGFYKGNE
ncbi:MAG TPA: polysaccharide deacetylase family protein [Ktedonobacteraceae bacterium]|nr:polysaccharide deacetylase family protein [Ktedonobacteraceae bacterium]